jgi:uncharacterized coiled-coil protein SlyX
MTSDRSAKSTVKAIAPYRVQSGVSLEDFQDFVSALEDKPININDRNFPGLSQLSEEFGFQTLSKKLSVHRRSSGLSAAQTAECLSRISVLEERTGQHEDQLAALQSALFPALQRFEATLARLSSELDAFRQMKKSNTARQAAAAPPPPAPATPSPSAAPTVPGTPARLESRITPQFPPLFDEFRAKCFKLLWRGSRDGFTAQEFHRRCDGRANTLTLIADTDGNVFGGFTPVKWENSGGYKGDESLRSFLFTLRNPHGVPPRKFALKAEKKHFAIWCNSADCRSFGYPGDISVADNCNANNHSSAAIGTHDSLVGDRTYANDTAFEYFLTSACDFTVKEIEVFEIADYTALPADVQKGVNGCFFQERARDAAGRPWETQEGDSKSGKTTNTRGGCS